MRSNALGQTDVNGKGDSILVSVIIPVFNVRHYLPQCLESITNQSYKNLEIILIDDGSSDDSGYICDQYATIDKRIIVSHIENKGLSYARNIGIRLAKGEYLLFIDSDDWVELHAVETLVKMASNYNADIVSARCCVEYVKNTLHSPKTEVQKVRVFQGKDIFSAYANRLIADVVWNKLYLADYFSDIIFPEGHNYEDVLVTKEIVNKCIEKNGKIVVLQEEMFHFRMRLSSISHTKTPNNIIDYWIANYGKYEGVPEIKTQLLPSCFMAIGRLWVNYYGFSKDDKALVNSTLCEMQDFSKTHFYQVMKEDFSILTKMACLLSQSRSGFVMMICYYFGKLRKMYRNTRFKMFD